MLFKQISQARNRNNNKTNKDISPRYNWTNRNPMQCKRTKH